MAPRGKKCHIILLYGDAARRSLRNLSSWRYVARPGAEREGGGTSDAYTVLWELRDPLLPASPRTDRGDRREIVSLLDIFVRLASNTLPDTWNEKRAFFYFDHYFESYFGMFLWCFSSGLNMINIFMGWRTIMARIINRCEYYLSFLFFFFLESLICQKDDRIW